MELFGNLIQPHQPLTPKPFPLPSTKVLFFFGQDALWGFSSPTRDQTHAVGVEVQCLKHWIAREVPFCYIFTATFPATAIVIFWGIVFSWVGKKSSQSLSRGLAL